MDVSVSCCFTSYKDIGAGHRKGDAVAMYDGRPNAELFLATGSVEDQNPSDCLAMKAELVKADRLYSSKKSIVESSGFSVSEVLTTMLILSFYFDHSLIHKLDC